MWPTSTQIVFARFCNFFRRLKSSPYICSSLWFCSNGSFGFMWPFTRRYCDYFFARKFRSRLLQPFPDSYIKVPEVVHRPGKGWARLNFWTWVLYSRCLSQSAEIAWYRVISPFGAQSNPSPGSVKFLLSFSQKLSRFTGWDGWDYFLVANFQCKMFCAAGIFSWPVT